MAAAIVKFDALADAVWTAAEDDDFFALRWTRFALNFAHHGGFVCGIHVRCLRFEFGGACVDPLEYGFDAFGDTGAAHIVFALASQNAEACVCEAEHLEFAQAFFVTGQAVCADNLFGIDDLADAIKEPRVKHCDAVNFFIGEAVAHGLCDGAHAVRCLLADRFCQGGFFWRAFDHHLIKASEA